MTVTSQTTKVTATGNSSARSFSFSPLVIFASTDITVTTTVTATGAETTINEGSTSSTYSVDITTYPATGSISYPASGGTLLPSTETITIKRVLTLEQQTDLNNQGAYSATVQEDQFDKLLMIDLQQQEIIDRSFAFPLTYTGSASAELPTPSANSYLKWNSDATALVNTTGASAVFTVPDGSASAPGLAFEDDTNSGWYRIGSDNVGLTLGGTKRIDYGTAGMSVTGTMTGSGILSIDDTTESTSGTSGSIHTDGGLGVAKKLHVIGTATHGGDILSDTDSTDSLGSTGVRWLKLWVDSIQTTANTDIAGNLTVTGNLTINGTTVTNDATNTEIKDPLIELNSGAGSNANDLGFIFERGSTGNNGFLGWDESGDYFLAGTTTATGASTGDITYSYAPFKCSAITATSGTLAGITSLGLNAGATITAGILDQDTMSSDSAVALATQQSIKAYVDSSSKAAGISMTWETTTTDTDQGVGKVWANNATLSSATVLYFDDVERNSVSINTLIDTLDDPTATNSATIYIQESGTATAGVVFKVSGAVTSASTYSKVAVTHMATFGTLSDGDVVGVTIAFSGNDGSGSGTVTQINAGAGFSFSAITTTGTIAVDGNLEDLDALGAVSSNSEMIVGTGSGAYAYESGATLRTSIGVGTGDSPQFTAVNIGAATDTTVTRVSAGVIAVEGATVGLISVKNTWSASQKSTVTALTSSSNSIAISMLTTNDYSHTFTENTTLANPSDTLVAGQSGSIFLTQAAGANYTLAFGSEYDFAGGTAPTVTATNAARDRLDYVVRADAKIEITALLNLS